MMCMPALRCTVGRGCAHAGTAISIKARRRRMGNKKGRDRPCLSGNRSGLLLVHLLGFLLGGLGFLLGLAFGLFLALGGLLHLLHLRLVFRDRTRRSKC